MFTRPSQLFFVALDLLFLLLSLAGTTTALPAGPVPTIPTATSSSSNLGGLSSLSIVSSLTGDAAGGSLPLGLGSHNPLSLLGRLVVPIQARAGDVAAPAVLDRAAGKHLIKRAERFQLRMARSPA